MRDDCAMAASSTRLLTCSEMGDADQAAIAGGVPGLALMENAGRSVAEEATDMTPGFGRVAVLCGPGNNGGDGFVAARYLARRGRRVRLGLLGERSALSGDAGDMARRWDGAVEPLDVAVLERADLIVDALFGAGLTRGIDPVGEIAKVFDTIAARNIPVLAVDLPSGLSGDDGVANGAVLQARRTVTFFRRKPGHLLLPGRLLCGTVKVADIGIPATVLTLALGAGDGDTFANHPSLWMGAWRAPALSGHKYDRGHAVVVSGGAEKAGAARLAAEAALRVGAGLVTLALPDGLAGLPGGQVRAIMQHSGQSAAELTEMLADRRKNAVVIGPGLGLDEVALEQVMAVLAAPAAAVLDADALAVAASAPEDVFRRIEAVSERSIVLTPHEGEFRRLFPDLDGGKLARARAAARRAGAVVVLKGADTVIASPDGRAAINRNAPATLATAGTGDVLSGLIGRLLARCMAPFEAAAAGVYIHGAAGNIVGSGLIADDIIHSLPDVLQGLEQTTL